MPLTAHHVVPEVLAAIRVLADEGDGVLQELLQHQRAYTSYLEIDRLFRRYQDDNGGELEAKLQLVRDLIDFKDVLFDRLVDSSADAQAKIAVLQGRHITIMGLVRRGYYAIRWLTSHIDDDTVLLVRTVHAQAIDNILTTDNKINDQAREQLLTLSREAKPVPYKKMARPVLQVGRFIYHSPECDVQRHEDEDRPLKEYGTMLEEQRRLLNQALAEQEGAALAEEGRSPGPTIQDLCKRVCGTPPYHAREDVPDTEQDPLPNGSEGRPSPGLSDIQHGHTSQQGKRKRVTPDEESEDEWMDRPFG